MLAAARAEELGIPLYRAAYTGVSMIVEPHGGIQAETAPFTTVARILTVRIGRVESIYARFGDWFVGVCVLGLLGSRYRSRSATPAA